MSSTSASLSDIQHLVLEHVDWDFYETLLRKLGDQPAQLTQFIDQLPFKDENSILREFLGWARNRKRN